MMINAMILAALVLLAGCADIGDIEAGHNVALACKPGGCGTAFAIDKNIWVTANHVVDDVDSIVLALESGDVVADVVVNIPESDIALLLTEHVVESPLDVCGPPRWGEHVCACGYAVDTIMGCECGTVFSKSLDSIKWIDERAYGAFINSQGGWSGGPVVNDDSCVVGVMIGGDNDSNVAIFTKMPGGLR